MVLGIAAAGEVARGVNDEYRRSVCTVVLRLISRENACKVRRIFIPNETRRYDRERINAMRYLVNVLTLEISTGADEAVNCGHDEGTRALGAVRLAYNALCRLALIAGNDLRLTLVLAHEACRRLGLLVGDRHVSSVLSEERARL